MLWLQRRSKRFWILTAVMAVAVLSPVTALAWWLGSPLFIDKTVGEDFPFAYAAVVPKGMKRGEVEDAMATLAKMDSPMEESMPKAMAQATAIKTGQFADADSRHRGEGTATIYRLPDGTHTLRLGLLKVTNGPDLHVVLTPHPNPGGIGLIRYYCGRLDTFSGP